MKRIYFDWASAAPVGAPSMRAFLEVSRAWGNPSSPHREGRTAKAFLEEARKTIAAMAGAKPDAVLFTSGATEANGLAIRGHVKALLAQGRAPSDIHLLYLPSAHASTVEVMEALGKEGIAIEALKLTNGGIDLEALKSQLRPATALVSMEVICGETGTRFDTRGVREVLDKHTKNKVLLLTDASQVPLVESFERTRLGADLLTLDASKVGGVRGIGALIAPLPVLLSPISEGGGQERGLRSGTQTPALAASFAAALVRAASRREQFVREATILKEAFLTEALKTFPGAAGNALKEAAPHIINISLPGVDTEYLAVLLDDEGIAVATRSACETDSSISRAVLALTGDQNRAQSTLRISFGPGASKEEFKKLLSALSRHIKFLTKT